MNLPQRIEHVTPAITGFEVAMLSDTLRFGLFELTTRIAVVAILGALGLSLMEPTTQLVPTVAAATILMCPIVLAIVRAREVWRAIVLHPGISLTVGPVALVVGVLSDRSAFHYPEMAWVASAAIAGGLMWAVWSMVVMTICSTLAGVLNGETGVLGEPLVVLGPRLLLALVLAALVEALAQLVWLGAVEVAQRQLQAETTAVVGADAPIDVDPAERPPRPPARLDAAGTPLLLGAAPERTPHEERPPRLRRKPLTDLEREVLECMADGLTVAGAARRLGIKPRTARARVEKARRRNGLGTSPALINWAVEQGLLAARRRTGHPVSAGGP